MRGLWAAVLIVSTLAAGTAFACPAASIRRGSIEVALAVNKERYILGQPVEMVLTVTNWGSQPVTLRFSDGQRYDFLVTTESGVRIWQWSHARAFTQALGTMPLAPAESRTFRERWDQKSSNGLSVSPGRCVIEGIFPPNRPRTRCDTA